jgi:hypothetical protein
MPKWGTSCRIVSCRILLAYAPIVVSASERTAARVTVMVLTGLVSEAAAQAYERLHAAGELRAGSGKDQFDVEGRPGRELLEAGLLSFAGAGEQQRFVRAVHPVIALRRLLDRQHRHIALLQSGLAESWERFAEMVAPTAGLGQGALDGEDVEAVRDPGEMARLAAGLYRSPRRLLRATFNARSGHNPTTEGLLLPPPDAVGAGVEFRMLYDAEHASDQWGSPGNRRASAGRSR